MRRALKVFVVIVVVLCALVAAVITALPFLVSTDAIRIRLAQELSVWTGYNVQLRDPPHISIFPAFKASLSGVTLTDATDNGTPLMDAECIEVDLSLLDAIMGRVGFSETRIIRPRFVIDEPVKTVAGFFNSLSRSQGSLGNAIREAHDLVEQNPQNPDASHLLAQPFGRILVENGTLVYPSDTLGNTKEIIGISATINWPDSTRAASLRTNARWNGALTDVTFNVEQALLLMGGGTSPIRFSINSNRGGITYTGNANFAQTFMLDGHVASRSPGWNKSMTWLGLDKTFGAQMTAPFVWESKLTATPDRLELNDIAFTLGNDSARGALETTFQNGLAATSGSIAFQSLNIEQLTPAFISLANGDPDLSFFDRFGLDIRLSAPQATFRTIELSNLAASAQLRNGRLIFDIGNAQIFSGAAQINVQLSRTDGAIGLESRLSLSNIDVDQFEIALARQTSLSTTANMTLTLNAFFKNWAELPALAKGEATLTLNSGRINSFDMDKFLNRLESGETVPLELTEGSFFAFDRVDAKGKIGNGLLQLDKAVIRFPKHLIELTGQFPLADTTLDITASLDRPQLKNGLCIDTNCVIMGLGTPLTFNIKGKWQELSASRTKGDVLQHP